MKPLLFRSVMNSPIFRFVHWSWVTFVKSREFSNRISNVFINFARDTQNNSFVSFVWYERLLLDMFGLSFVMLKNYRVFCSIRSVFSFVKSKKHRSVLRNDISHYGSLGKIHGLCYIVKKGVFMVVKNCIPEADFCLM